MSFTEQIQIEINTVFDASGFKQLRKNMASVSEKFEAMGRFFRQAKGMSNMVQEAREFEQVLEQANLRFDRLNDKRKGGDLQEQRVKSMVGGSGTFGKGDTAPIMELGGVFRDITGESIKMGEALKRVGAIISDFKMRGMQFPDQLRDPGTILGEGFNVRQFQMPNIQNSMQDSIRGLPQLSAEDLGPGTQGSFLDKKIDVEVKDNLDRGRFGELKNRLIKLRNNDKVVNGIDRVRSTASGLTGGLRRGAAGARAFSGALTGVMGGALSSVTPSVQNLQMKLLGLQFTMLTIAFLFGGLATGALGAVGVFETLSNTFKFLFLPSALNVLDSVLKLQEVVFGLSRPFREAIGNASLAVAAFASIVSVAAILGKAILSVIGPLATLAGFLGGPLSLLLAVAGALGLIAFRGSLAAKEGSKLNGFLETAGNLASQLFKFTGQAAAKLGQFLSSMLSDIGQFFMEADWGQIWSNFFDFAANARDKAGKFMSDTFSKLKSKSEKINWNKVWEQFFDFTGEGMEEANNFLTDTINRFATWADDEADWKQIWSAFFEFQNTAAEALGRFLGQMLGNIVKFIMNIDFSELFKASMDASVGRQEALQEQRSQIQSANLGESFVSGFQQGLVDAKFNDGPELGPQDSASVKQTRQTLNLDVSTTINGKNTTTKEDSRTINRNIVGLFQDTSTSATAAGRGVPE